MQATLRHPAKQILSLKCVRVRQLLYRFCSTPPPKPPEVLNDYCEIKGDNLPSGSELLSGVKKSVTILHRKQSVEDVPLKRILASTNKMLFGPLLETSQEKKKRLKRENLGKGDKGQPRKQKIKKNEPKSRFLPLILTPENSHYMHVDIPGNMRNLSPDESTMNKGNVSEGVGNVVLPDNKKIITLNPNSNTVGNLDGSSSFYSYQNKENNKRNSHTNRKKIILVPRSSALEKNFPFSHRAFGNAEEINIDVRNIENSKAQCERNTDHVKEQLTPFSNVVDYKSDICDLDSFLEVNNSKFSAVPKSLDIKAMENFPLFSNIMPTYCNNKKENISNRENIISIGMFDGGYQKLPSVRKILDETMPRANRLALERWKAKLIKELGEEGFNEYREGLLSRGKILHSCIQSELSGELVFEEHIVPAEKLWMSVKTVLPRVSNVQVLESRLIHPYLYYQGAVDCIASYRGMPVLIEWKSSTKPKLSIKSMFDDPLQVVAYLGALNYDSNYRLPHPIESAMLVVAYESGLPAHVHMLKKEDCELFWRMWCARLCQFWRNPMPEKMQVN